MSNALVKFRTRITRSDKGATMVEYGIMVALIAVIVLAAVGPLGNAIAGFFNQITAAL